MKIHKRAETIYRRTMIRVRFYTSSVSDPRPVKFPPPGPWWCTGYAGDMSYAVVVAYVDKKTQVKKFWPEATKLDFHAEEEPVFTDRFPKPKWWKPQGGKGNG